MELITDNNLYRENLDKLKIKEVRNLYDNIWSYSVNDTDDLIELNHMMYVPLIISISTVDYSLNEIDELRSFLPEFVTANYQEPDQITHQVRDDLIEFYPVKNGHVMYVHNEMITYFDPNKYLGYTFVTLSICFNS